MNIKFFTITVAFLLIFASLGFSIQTSSEQQDADSSKNDTISHKYYYDSDTGIYKVKAGGGGGRIVVMKYYPTTLEIKVGDTVTWYNPTLVPEPHTVTFLTDNNYLPQFEAPFQISDPSSLVPLPNDLNSEPYIIPLGVGEARAVIASNARVTFPFVIGSDGQSTNLGVNANYVYNGTEKYLNSGYLMPTKYVDQVPGSSDSFTVKFAKAGEFQYTCMFHPWMSGKISVTG